MEPSIASREVVSWNLGDVKDENLRWLIERGESLVERKGPLHQPASLADEFASFANSDPIATASHRS